MYKNLRRWDDGIKLAERRGYYKIDELKAEHMSFLLNSGNLQSRFVAQFIKFYYIIYLNIFLEQEEKAGQVLEEQGDTDKAMTLYLKAKKPAKAARLAIKYSYLLQNSELMSRVTTALIKSGIIDSVHAVKVIINCVLNKFYLNL